MAPQPANETPLGAPPLGPSLRDHAVRGSAWTLAWRLCVKLLGAGTTFILVRLLTPADFGVYAMAMLAVQLVEAFGDTGQELALIRLGTPSRAHFDTAWTLQVIIYLGLAVCVVAIAPLAGLYFRSTQVAILVAFLSLRLAIAGFTNIGVVSFRIELDFAADFRFGVYQKLTTAAIGISAAFLLRNYWALAISVVLIKVVAVALSYAMHPFRPRFSLAKAHEIWNFSVWMLVVSVSEQLSFKLDEFIVGATSTPHTMGAYNVSADLAMTPTAELVQPTMRPLFPLYSKLLGDPARFRDAALMAIGGTATICFATGPGLAMVSRELVSIFLGRGWEDATPLIFWLSLGAIAIGMNYVVYTILSVTGKPRLTAFTIWARMALLLPALLIAAHYGDAVMIAAARAAIGLVIVCSNLFLIMRVIESPLPPLLAQLYRPATAGLLMVGALFLADRIGVGSIPTAGMLLLKIGLGAMIYLAVLAVAWRAAGRPDGIEGLAIATATGLFRRLAWRR